MKGKKDVDVSGPKAQKARSNYPGQERETLRLGTPQARLAEKVVDAVENPDALNRARKALYETTGEAARLPNLDDAVAERSVMFKKSKSSKK